MLRAMLFMFLGAQWWACLVLELCFGVGTLEQDLQHLFIDHFPPKCTKKEYVQESGPHHAQAAHDKHGEPGPIK